MHFLECKSFQIPTVKMGSNQGRTTNHVGLNQGGQQNMQNGDLAC